MYKVRNIYTPKQEKDEEVNVTFKSVVIVFLVFMVILFIIPRLLGLE